MGHLPRSPLVMKFFLVLALILALFSVAVVADHATPDDDDDLPSGTFGPRIRPITVHYQVQDYQYNFNAPPVDFENPEQVDVEYTTQTVTIFSGFWGHKGSSPASPSDDNSSSSVLGVSALAAVAGIVMLFYFRREINP